MKKNIGSPKIELILDKEKKKNSFLRKIREKRGAINWAIVVIFFIGFLSILFFSLAPFFSVENQIASSSFGVDIEQKIIQDYYELPEVDDRVLPFKDINKVSSISNIEETINNELSGLKGVYGVYVKNLNTGEEIKINTNSVFTAASLTKLFVVGAYYKELQQNPNLANGVIVLADDDRVEGAGSIIDNPTGSKYSPKTLIEKMLKESDNTAFSMMIRYVGFNKVVDFISDSGFSNTSFKANTTTPNDIAKFLKYLYNEELFGDYYSKEIVDMMTGTYFEDRIPYYLPIDLNIAHKIGSWTGAYSDAGIVYGGFKSDDYIIVVMTEDAYYEEGINTIRRLSKVVYDYFGGEE